MLEKGLQILLLRYTDLTIAGHADLTCLITVFLHLVSQLVFLANPGHEKAGLTQVVPQTIQALVPQPHDRVHLTNSTLHTVAHYNSAQGLIFS